MNDNPWTLTIPTTPESNNRLLRMDRHERQRLVYEWRQKVGLLAKVQRVRFEAPVRLDVTFYFPDRITRDLINYAAGLDKQVIDALVDVGIVKDDSGRHIPEITLRYRVDPERPRTELQLTAIESLPAHAPGRGGR